MFDYLIKLLLKIGCHFHPPFNEAAGLFANFGGFCPIFGELS